MLSGNQIISSEEIDQFRHEVDEYLDQVKQTILKMDGRNIELIFLSIRTEQMRRGFIIKHAHDKFEHVHWYISAAVAPVGLGTYYVQSLNGERKNPISFRTYPSHDGTEKNKSSFGERGPSFTWYSRV